MKQPPAEIPARLDDKHAFERPDGYWWQDARSGKMFGPFPTLGEAINDMESSGESDIEVGETLAEAEDEIGIANWVDPETGEPAEEHPPHPGDE